MYLYKSLHIYAGAWKGQKSVLDHVKMKLQAVVRYLTWVLETKLCLLQEWYALSIAEPSLQPSIISNKTIIPLFPITLFLQCRCWETLLSLNFLKLIVVSWYSVWNRHNLIVLKFWLYLISLFFMVIRS